MFKPYFLTDLTDKTIFFSETDALFPHSPYSVVNTLTEGPSSSTLLWGSADAFEVCVASVDFNLEVWSLFPAYVKKYNNIKRL